MASNNNKPKAPTGCAIGLVGATGGWYKRGKYEIGFVNQRLYCYNCATITFLLGTHCIQALVSCELRLGCVYSPMCLRLDGSCMCSGMYANCYEFSI